MLFQEKNKCKKNHQKSLKAAVGKKACTKAGGKILIFPLSW